MEPLGRIANLVHRHSPGATLSFNNYEMTTADQHVTDGELILTRLVKHYQRTFILKPRASCDEQQPNLRNTRTEMTWKCV